MTSNVEEFFNEVLPAAMAKKPEYFKEIGQKYTFRITGEGGGEWYVNVSDSGPLVTQGDLGNSNATITMSSEDFQTIYQDPTTIQQLYFTGRLKMFGDQMAFINAIKIFSFKD